MASFYFKLNTSKSGGECLEATTTTKTTCADVKRVPIRKILNRVSCRVESLDMPVGLWRLKHQIKVQILFHELEALATFDKQAIKWGEQVELRGIKIFAKV